MEKDPIILHLSVTEDECLVDQNNALPQAYENSSNGYMTLETTDEVSKDLPDLNIFAKNQNRKMHASMKPTFNETNPRVWPQSTDIACWWCCHSFESKPVTLPMSFIDGKYNMLGCFCSFNCSSAYNFSLKDNMVYERETLIKKIVWEMSESMAPSLGMIPSPPKEVLKRFGGILTIDEYRKNNATPTKKYWVINPPVMVMIPQIEEIRSQQLSMINKIKTSNDKNSFIPLDLDAVSKAAEKLKNKKLTIRSNNCLEITMGIRQEQR